MIALLALLAAGTAGLFAVVLLTIFGQQDDGLEARLSPYAGAASAPDEGDTAGDHPGPSFVESTRDSSR